MFQYTTSLELFRYILYYLDTMKLYTFKDLFIFKLLNCTAKFKLKFLLCFFVS
jgi:hypothetical protein